MGIPKKGSRKITVDGENFIWLKLDGNRKNRVSHLSRLLVVDFYIASVGLNTKKFFCRVCDAIKQI